VLSLAQEHRRSKVREVFWLLLFRNILQNQLVNMLHVGKAFWIYIARFIV